MVLIVLGSPEHQGDSGEHLCGRAGLHRYRAPALPPDRQGGPSEVPG